MIERVAYLSLHTSPLLQPGSGDAGGMNVYIDELAQTMADRGVHVDVFTRAIDPNQAPIVQVSERYRVIHIAAGPMLELPVAQLTDHVFEFAESVIEWVRRSRVDYDVVHSHYWLSGWAGLMVKRVLDIPLANSFHTLGRVKDATRREDQAPSGLVRVVAEHDVISGSDCVIASTPAEYDDLLTHYGADPTRLCTSRPGVNHIIFKPGDKGAAREALGLDPSDPMVLFVGRIQALKGVDVAIDAFSQAREHVPGSHMVVVGGASGPHGFEEVDEIHQQVKDLDISDAVTFVPPVPHADLATYYQAADLLIFPSRSESFGLVAAEAQACGTPVIAARVGGLEYVVADGESGVLVDGWDADDYAETIARLLGDDERREAMAAEAVRFADQFSWQATTDRLLELYAGIQG